MIRGQALFVGGLMTSATWRGFGAFENFTGLGKWTAQLGHRGIWPLDNPCDDKYALITGTERLLLLLFCFQIQILVCLDQPNGE